MDEIERQEGKRCWVSHKNLQYSTDLIYSFILYRWRSFAATMLFAGLKVVKAAVRLEDLEPIPEDEWPEILSRIQSINEITNG